MKKKIEGLKFLIESQEAQEKLGNLTEIGKAYLQGLKCAYAMFVPIKEGSGKE